MLPNLLIGLCSNGTLKTHRFLSSLARSIYTYESRATWGDIVVISVPHSQEYNDGLAPSLRSDLARTGVRFLQKCPDIPRTLSRNDRVKRLLLEESRSQYGIAACRNRTILAMLAVSETEHFDLFAILDDDLLFENAIVYKSASDSKYQVWFKHTYDYWLHLHKILQFSKMGPITGGNTGCPPIPASSAIASLLADRMKSLDYSQFHSLIEAQWNDYYYDLSEKPDQSAMHGAWLPFVYRGGIEPPSLYNMLTGVTSSRALLFDEELFLSNLDPTRIRGGNTYFGSREQFAKIPHISLSVNGISTRRSDMIVAEFGSHNGLQYYQTYFPLGHFRLPEKSTELTIVFIQGLIAETFGVVFHRTFRAFLLGDSWKKVWDHTYERRLNDLRAMLSKAQESLMRHHTLYSTQELSIVQGLCRWERIATELHQLNQAFKDECTYVVNNLSDILRCWNAELGV